MSHTNSALLNNAPYSFFRSALKSVVVPALGLCGLLMAPSASADDHIFSEMDVFGIEYASDPQVSPDGSQVAYVRTSMDIMTCLLYTSPSPRDRTRSRMPSSA